MFWEDEDGRFGVLGESVDEMMVWGVHPVVALVVDSQWVS
jgi:hypothetical protein